MTPRLSGHFSLFGLGLFVLKSLLGIARQWSREKFAIMTLKPQSHVRILIYIERGLFANKKETGTSQLSGMLLGTRNKIGQ